MSLEGWTVHHHNGGRLGEFERNKEVKNILNITDLSKTYHLDFILCNADKINVTSEEECDLIVGRSNNFQKIRIKQGETCKVTIEKLAKNMAWVRKIFKNSIIIHFLNYLIITNLIKYQYIYVGGLSKKDKNC